MTALRLSSTLLASCLALASLCSAQAQTASGSGLVVERTLSADAALELATVALHQCRSAGYKVTITVLNRHARPVVVLSDDGVNPHTIENSERKAYTAFTTRAPSGDVGKRAQPGLSGFLQLDKISPLEGGLPIWSSNKELVGAVGISGAPGGDKDAACGQAGIDRIAPKLAG
ncbi:MAG TPA: heme-binding protein [Candidatus Aquabacterium excrementipullorum]|nr:heme-binding protein [Candidatus Aquabacterium excrementipullorum]